MQIAKALSMRRVWDPRKIEWVIGALITAGAVYLHWVNFRSAGALWRDEAGVVRIATLPAAREMWSNIGHESCPILFPSLIRAWSVTVGDSDAALRLFGFIVGLLMLGAVWLNGWFFARSAPLIALGLLAVNPSVVRWGDALRAYGLASVLMLVTLAIVWRFARSPDRKSWIVAALAAVISVQCLFQNSFLLLAVCAAAAAVRVRCHDFKNGLAALAIGVPAAISLLPYRVAIRDAQAWSVLSQIGFLSALIWSNLSVAMAPIFPWLRWLDHAGGRRDCALREERARLAACAERGFKRRCVLRRGQFDRRADQLLDILVDRENADAGLVFSAASDFWRSLHRHRARELACALAGLAVRICDSRAPLFSRCA